MYSRVYMNYITTTQLRTMSPKLVELLLAGSAVNLIYRSRIIGEIKPKTDTQPKVFNAKRMAKILESLNLPKSTPAERERNYRKAMLQKHGQHFS